MSTEKELKMESVETTNQASEKKRGFWLSAFLILMFIANPFTAFTYFTNPGVIIDAYPNATIGILYFLGFMSICNIVLAALIWAWKKIGVYGFYAVVAIAFATNLYIGLGIVGSLTGLIGGVIIFFTTKKRWAHFA
jgi:hypothetical protein